MKRARELARAALGKVAEGQDPVSDKQAARAVARAPKPEHDMIELVAASFVERHAKQNCRQSTWREIERIMHHEIIPAWRGRRLSGITRADVHAMLDKIIGRKKPVMANRVLAVVNQMCSWAIDRGLIGANPCSGIKPPSAETARDRVLSDTELSAVWNACDAIGWPFGAVVKMLVLTGQRRSEAAGMRWGEIDFEKRVWTLPKERCKNNREHTIPLSSTAIAVLTACPRITSESGYVFTFDGSAPVHGFTAAKIRLGKLLPQTTPPWHLHDIRRTFASGCAGLGVPIHVVEKLLNHVSGSFAGIVGVYQRHDFAGEQRSAAETWARHVEAIVSGGTAGNVVELKARG